MVSCSSSGSMSARPPGKVHGEGEAATERGPEDRSPHSADGIASMDLFVEPTVSFQLLYGVLIPQHVRRELVWLGVTAHPTAEWTAQQLVGAFGWRETTAYHGHPAHRVDPT
jgi:hypothetical protein